MKTHEKTKKKFKKNLKNAPTRCVILSKHDNTKGVCGVSCDIRQHALHVLTKDKYRSRVHATDDDHYVDRVAQVKEIE